MGQWKFLGYIPFGAIALIFLIDFAFIFATHWQWEKAMGKYIPVEKELGFLRNELAEGHLWLEELITGDTSVDIEKDIYQKFSYRLYSQKSAQIKALFSEPEDQSFYKELIQIEYLLAEFEQLSKRRIDNIQKSGVGSDIDQYFDDKFTQLLTLIDHSLFYIQQQLANELAKRQSQFLVILTLFFILNALIFVILFLTKRAKDRFEASLFEEKERAEVTLHSIGDAVITTDKEGRVTYLNEVAESLTGFSVSEAKAKPLDEVFNIKNAITGIKVESPADKVLREGKIVGLANSTKLVSQTGEEYIISDSASPIRDKSGQLIGVVLVFQDDTERHQMQTELVESERKYRRLVENLKHHYFFYSHDIDGNFTFVSNSIKDVLGYEVQDFLESYDYYLTDEKMNEKVHLHTQESMRGVQPPPYELSIYHADGSIRYLEVTEFPIANNMGDVIAVEGVAKDITDNVLLQRDLQAKREHLENMAHYDALTGLSNRVLFFDRLEQSLRKMRRHSEEVCVLFIDLDRFKEVNDSFGHHFGDSLLQEFSQRLKQCVRASDTVSRLGGDEFGVILDEFEEFSQVINVIQKIMSVISAPFIIEKQSFYITLSIGVSVAPNDGNQAEVLLKNADAAMYRAKEEGRNTYRFYTQDMTEKALERITLASRLKEAIKQNELVLHYQPQINTQTDQLIGIEALVRWNHPEEGLIPPGDFIPIAEETGLIIELDEWVMLQAMQQTASWYQQGFNPGVTSINLSVKQLIGSHFILFVKQMLETTGCQPEWIEFEVTETQIMKRPEESIRILNEIKALGILISVDDFGTGYSSLSYLKRLPIDKLKIDRSFVIGLPHDEEDVAISKAIIALSQSLRLETLAEGVETSEQRDFLLEYGCIKVQGYFYSRPVEAKVIESKYLSKN